MGISARVISLPESTERREAFADRASSATTRWSFFDAHRCLSGNLQYKPELALICKGRHLTASELACYSSHFALWEEFVNTCEDALIVLEDDAVPIWKFIDSISLTDLSSKGIGFLRLFSGFAAQGDLVGRVNGRRVFRNLGYQYGAVAYLLTRSAATELVRHCRTVRRPIDDEMDRVWAHGVEKFAVYPPVVMEDFTASTIGTDRWAAAAKGPLKLRVARRVLMLSDGWASRTDPRLKPRAAKVAQLFLTACEGWIEKRVSAGTR